MNRRAYVEPLKQFFRRISTRDRNANTAFRSGIGRNKTGPVDKNIPGNLNAPGHRRVVVKTGKMTFGLVGPRLKVTLRSVTGATGADIRLHVETVTVVGPQRLLRYIDLNAFPSIAPAF